MKLEGKRAVITGAASGIGQATAEALAGYGAHVVLADLNTQGLKNVGDRLGRRGTIAATVPTDVSDAEAVQTLMDTAAQTLGGLDIVVNVAGIQRSASVEETDEHTWDAHFHVNTKSCYLTTRYALPHLRRCGGGAITSVASIAGIKGMAGLSAYSASKGAIVALTRSLAVELADDHIRVNCLCPGWTDTPFNDPIITFMGGVAERDQMVHDTVPLRRQASPSEMAEVLAFLSSESASYMTGQIIIADGGKTL